MKGYLKFLGWYSIVILVLTALTLATDAVNGVDTASNVMAIALLLPILHFVFRKTRE